MWMLLAILFVSGFCGAFQFAAFDSSYAMLVPERQLARANGMMQTMTDLPAIISPALAAGLVSLLALARQGLLGSGLGQVLGRPTLG
jgi:MFS transporter, DHA3 family, macrolide efflux protein